MDIKDAKLAEIAKRVMVDSATVKYADVKEIDPAAGLSEDALSNLKAISPGLVLEAGNEVTFHGFVETKVDSSAITTRSKAFKPAAKSRVAVYALVTVNGRDTRIMLENLINPVSLTGVIEPDHQEKIKTYNADTKCFQPLGASSVSEVLSWTGKTKKVVHALSNFSREVNASAKDFEGQKETLRGLNAYWFAK
jgi:hypothetical protein